MLFLLILCRDDTAYSARFFKLTFKTCLCILVVTHFNIDWNELLFISQDTFVQLQWNKMRDLDPVSVTENIVCSLIAPDKLLSTRIQDNSQINSL